ncbi:PREDICTED: LOW QUALITY PROTEIN: ferritin heavy polypeptide-like 17 [Dipodomys ordii]|uniref:Ferritin n=1 Tax=Dipodomys ordii TaxID=10020 RepID=A0A1S3G052_DIPOR|nr:PREDICTED: LOW QUALITY PROTEIN: ferritin heavy polypeptide-like 17 [Dipodomys ordii]
MSGATSVSSIEGSKKVCHQRTSVQSAKDFVVQRYCVFLIAEALLESTRKDLRDSSGSGPQGEHTVRLHGPLLTNHGLPKRAQVPSAPPLPALQITYLFYVADIIGYSIPTPNGHGDASQVQNNYCQECEAAINNQIHLQLYAAYMYLSMAFYCDREEVALGHFSWFFLWQSHKWTQHAEKLLWIQNQRGSHISLNQIDMSGYHNWHGSFQVMEYAFNLEMTITQSLMELYHLAAIKGDTELSEFLKHHCLQQQLDTLEELRQYLTNLHNMWALGDTLVQYLFSQLSLRKKEK